MISSGSRAVTQRARRRTHRWAARAGPAGPASSTRRAAGQQERGRVRVRLGEREVAAERAGVADPDVGDAGLEAASAGSARRTIGRTLDLAMGGRGPDPQRPVGLELECPAGRAIPLRSIRVRELGEAHLHDLEELRPAGDVRRRRRRRRRTRRRPRPGSRAGPARSAGSWATSFADIGSRSRPGPCHRTMTLAIMATRSICILSPV